MTIDFQGWRLAHHCASMDRSLDHLDAASLDHGADRTIMEAAGAVRDEWEEMKRLIIDIMEGEA